MAERWIFVRWSVHVKQAYSFRTQTTIIYARESYFFYIRCQCHDTVHYGLIFFRSNNKLRRPNRDNQPSRTLSLHGPGLIHSLPTCYITSTNLWKLPELTGSLQAKLETPSIYLPNVSAITDQETHQLENILQADTARIEVIALQLKERIHTFDIDSLFHVHKITQQEQQTHPFVLILSLEYFVSHYTPSAINYDVIHFLVLRTQNFPLKPPLLPLN
jgi:hypothetical protein